MTRRDADPLPRSAKRFAWPLLALLAAGCDLAPRHPLPAVAVPARYRESRDWQLAAPADRIPRGAWWRAFGDPELDRLEAGLDDANPTLQAALATTERAGALARETESGLAPSISVGGQAYSERQSNRRPRRGLNQPNSYPDTIIDTRARYELDLWGRVANQVRAGRALAQAAQDELANARLSLHAELAETYIGLRGLDAEADVLRRSADTFAEGARLTRNRFAGGIAPLLDVTRAESQLQAAEAQLDRTMAGRARAEHRLARLVGSAPGAFTLPTAPWRLRAPVPEPGLPSALLQRRPDIATAERQVAAANAQVGVARAAFYPTLSLDLLYGLQAASLNVFSLPNSFWAIGPGVAMPLFENGLRTAERDAALAAWRITTAQYRQTVLDAFAEVEDGLSDTRLMQAALQRNQAGAAAADKSLELATNLYRDGASNFLEVVVAQNEALTAERNLVGARTRRTLAALGLIRALGGGWRNEAGPPG